MSRKDFPRGRLRHPVRQGKLEVLGQELFDVGSLDVGRLFQLDDLEDLIYC